MGIENAGKSTLINKMLKDKRIDREVLVSKIENTTRDFIKLKIDNKVIYDTPGFNYVKLARGEKYLNPISFKVRENTTFIINGEISFYFKDPNRVIFYINSEDIKREYKKDKSLNKEIKVIKNGDIVLPGLGFINIKEEALVLSNREDLEVRSNISEW